VQPPEDFDGKAYTGDGPAINSGFLDGMGKDRGQGARSSTGSRPAARAAPVNYKLRDWLFSRQRYWGEPFPIVYDERGHHHGVGEDACRSTLPPMDDYQPVESDDPQPLLAKATDWVNTTAGEAGVEGLPADAPCAARRTRCPAGRGAAGTTCATATRRTTSGSSGDATAERAYWLGDLAHGVDLYIGGAEHAVLHLLYARFWHKVLFDLGEVIDPRAVPEAVPPGADPQPRVPAGGQEPRAGRRGREPRHRGRARVRRDRDGRAGHQIVAKMSKSLKNVVNPDDVIAEFGADTFRLYEMYMGPLEQSKPWDTRDDRGHVPLPAAGLAPVHRRGDRRAPRSRRRPDGRRAREALHRTIAKVGGRHRAAGVQHRDRRDDRVQRRDPKGGRDNSADAHRDQIDRFARILAPFAPHLAEEIADASGARASRGRRRSAWPEVDEAMLTDDEVEIPVQILGKVRGKVTDPRRRRRRRRWRTLALADERIKALIEGKTVRKVIVVPGRLVNIVAN
jgi:leucyl-tRNA synthetase